MSGRLQRAVQILLHVEDTPHRIALAFALGVFIAFTPVLGLHTALALLIAFRFRLSRAAILIGAYINNPWTLAPIYTAGTLLGCLLLGVSPAGLAEIDWSEDFYGSMIHVLRPYVWPFVLGNTALGIVAGAGAYLGLKAILERRRGSAA